VIVTLKELIMKKSPAIGLALIVLGALAASPAATPVASPQPPAAAAQRFFP
jgi:hypothetical protein